MHTEMKDMFEESMKNIQEQNQPVSSDAIEMQASKAVEEILNRGKGTQTAALEEEIEKQKQVIEEMKQKESDQISSLQTLETKLIHA